VNPAVRGQAHAAPMTALPNHRYLLTRLQREWNEMSCRRSSIRRATSWQLTVQPVASLDDLLALTGFGDDADAPGSDVIMGRLVALARHDDLAARIVLQRMLPGLSSCARRHARNFDGRIDALDELMSEAWTVIRTFPIDQRHCYVIKNLLRDCEYRAFLKPRRRLLTHELTDPARLDHAVETDERPEAMTTIVRLLGRAKATGMSADDIAVVATLLNTSTIRQAAAALHVTERTVRNRRDAVVRQLQVLAEAA
jgi:hypothetical protein